ncbi:MAG: hypothetical protein NW217_01135 [Hyphomicrobiaceae bacterium]|nr:hypothetical protein [Hyphomicrobiaceae bacterium]
MTTRPHIAALALALSLAAHAPAAAQAPDPSEAPAAGAGQPSPGASGRYTMSPVEGGYVRLDTVTGEMSLCTGKDGAWSCMPMPDSARSLTTENERLKTEKKALEDEVRRMEDEFVTGRAEKGGPLAGPDGDGRPGGPGVPNLNLPSEDDVDRAVDYLEGMIRKFRERFEDFGDKTDPDRVRPPRQPDSDPAAPVPRTSNEGTRL